MVQNFLNWGKDKVIPGHAINANGGITPLINVSFRARWN
jgi:hypothetical protein